MVVKRSQMVEQTDLFMQRWVGCSICLDVGHLLLLIITRKAPGALDPAVSPPPRGANTLQSLKICAQVV